jgi:hypothetical protein
MLTKSEITAIFAYKEGLLFWKFYSPGRKINKPAGNIDSVLHYRRIQINKKRYSAYRIIWVMFNGIIPKNMEIDHINHIRSDDRIENLRLVTKSENHRNLSRSKNNKSGCTGVNKHNGSWRSVISFNGKTIYLGSFKRLDRAIAVRKEAEKIYDYHENHGKNGGIYA